ncbi:MAG: extracellular solute-binding protein [Hyphomicrobiaceae bacterium]|nr:extracellular solute-binding protein [Hyphomicrobiaceae bacterium]
MTLSFYLPKWLKYSISIAFTTFITLSGIYAQQAKSSSEINLYSSRHYDTDKRLYSDFENKTGIKIRRIEDKADALINRITAEGDNSPADILITVDAGRLWAADQLGLFQPTHSKLLNSVIPRNLRHPDGHWFGFSTRARVIFYDKKRIGDPPRSYLALADTKYKGLVCTRSSSNIYMLSLMSNIIERLGEEAAKDWAAGVWNNRARYPEGGDTDQLRGIASGQCGIAIANTYYFARALRKKVRNLSGKTNNIGIIFPNQNSTGTHINISGAGILTKSPNRANAIKFLEYLASKKAQTYFAAGNDEYPVLKGAAPNTNIVKLGAFKSDNLDLTIYGKNQALAQRLYDEVGYR